MAIATTTLALAGLATGILGAGVSAYGSYQNAQAQAQAANYQAQVARNNQIIEQQNAQLALQQGQAAEQNERQKTAQMIGGRLAQEAASGIEPNSGSPLNVRSSEKEMGELDALTTRENYDLQARNFVNAASGYGAQAGLLQAQAGWDRTAGDIGMMSSLLGGASSVSSKWLQYRQWGVPGFGSGGGNAAGSGIDPYQFAYA
jgi:hypothetical protein